LPHTVMYSGLEHRLLMDVAGLQWQRSCKDVTSSEFLCFIRRVLLFWWLVS